MSETRVLLLRHAETSAPDRFHGAESDIGLGPRGFSQAESVARSLSILRTDALHTSAMLRARQTAEAIGRACALTPLIEPDLHERKMGPLSGLSRLDGMSAYDEAKRRWTAGDVDYSHEGGESYAQIRARVVPIIERLVSRAPGQTLVIVAHGVVIRVLLCALLKGQGPADFPVYKIDNAAVNDLRHDGHAWTAVALNQVVEPAENPIEW